MARGAGEVDHEQEAPLKRAPGGRETRRPAQSKHPSRLLAFASAVGRAAGRQPASQVERQTATCWPPETIAGALETISIRLNSRSLARSLALSIYLSIYR